MVVASNYILLQNETPAISRILPPKINENNPSQIIKERNVLIVLVDDKDKIFIENKEVRLTAIKPYVKQFYLNPDEIDSLSEKETKYFEDFGKYPVSKGVISLQNDKRTSYKLYISVQNELLNAVKELREETSKTIFNLPYDKLPLNQQNIINEIHPLSISEAVPKTN